MFLSPHPPWQWWSVVHIPATVPSNTSTMEITKSWVGSSWKSNAFDSSTQSGCIISPFAGIGAKRDALSVTKELWRSIPPTAHAKCQMQLGKIGKTERNIMLWTRTVSWICIFCICCLCQCLPVSCPWEVGTMCPRGSSHPLWWSHIPKWENGFLMRADYPANLVILSNALDFTPSLSSLEVKS